MIIGTSSPPYRPWLPTLPPLASPPYRPWLPSLPPLATRHTLPSPRTAIGVTRGRYGSVRLHHLDDHRDSTGILPGEHTDADQAQGVAGTLAADINNAIRSPRDRPPPSAELNRETRTRHALDTHSSPPQLSPQRPLTSPPHFTCCLSHFTCCLSHHHILTSLLSSSPLFSHHFSSPHTSLLTSSLSLHTSPLTSHLSLHTSLPTGVHEGEAHPLRPPGAPSPHISPHLPPFSIFADLPMNLIRHPRCACAATSASDINEWPPRM